MAQSTRSGYLPHAARSSTPTPASARRFALAGRTSAVIPSAASLGRRLETADDIADLLPGLDVPVGLDDLLQPIRSVDDRLELPGLDQLPEIPDHRLVMFRDGEQDLLAAM